MLRRLLSGILVIGLLLSLFPLSVMAEGETEEAPVVVPEESVEQAPVEPAEETPEQLPVPPTEEIPELPPAEPVAEETETSPEEPEETPAPPAEEPETPAPSETEPPAEESAAEEPAGEEVLPEEIVTYPRSTEVPLVPTYDFSEDTGVISDSFAMLIRELVYCMEQTRQTVLPLDRTEVCYEVSEKVFLEDMADILAAFTVRIGWDRPDQEPLDQASRLLLRRVFWDMICLYPVLDEDYNEYGELERVLRFHISVKSAEQIGWQYFLKEEERQRAIELSKDESVLALCFPQPRTEELLEEYGVVLPADLMPLRGKIAETALSLVGRVQYFWGGKPGLVGWDNRWGAPAVVKVGEGDAVGSVGAWGLDCSGFVGWVFGTAVDDLDAALAVGYGTANQWANTVEIPMQEMQTGDLVWMAMGSAEDTHVGILIGFTPEGKAVVCHCNTGGVAIDVLDSCEMVRTPQEFYRQHGTAVAPSTVKSSGSSADTRYMKGAKIG